MLVTVIADLTHWFLLQPVITLLSGLKRPPTDAVILPLFTLEAVVSVVRQAPRMIAVAVKGAFNADVELRTRSSVLHVTRLTSMRLWPGLLLCLLCVFFSRPPPSACASHSSASSAYSVRSGLQRFQLAPGRSALLAAPVAVHGGQGKWNRWAGVPLVTSGSPVGVAESTAPLAPPPPHPSPLYPSVLIVAHVEPQTGPRSRVPFEFVQVLPLSVLVLFLFITCCLK